jgi:hypothetical protein
LFETLAERKARMTNVIFDDWLTSQNFKLIREEPGLKLPVAFMRFNPLPNHTNARNGTNETAK